MGLARMQVIDESQCEHRGGCRQPARFYVYGDGNSFEGRYCGEHAFAKVDSLNAYYEALDGGAKRARRR